MTYLLPTAVTSLFTKALTQTVEAVVKAKAAILLPLIITNPIIRLWIAPIHKGGAKETSLATDVIKLVT